MSVDLAVGRPCAGSGWREADIMEWIRKLTTEKNSLRAGHKGRTLSTAETTRLHKVELTLDETWNLIRHRRARRAAGKGWEDLSQQVAVLFKEYSS